MTIPTDSDTVRVGVFWAKLIGWVGTLFFLGLFVAAAATAGTLAALMFLPFILLGVLALVIYGPIEMNSEEVRMRAPTGLQAMRWREVRGIRYGNSHLILVGESKRLVLPLTFLWSGIEKSTAIAVLNSFILDSKNTPKPSATADILLSKGCKKAANSRSQDIGSSS